MATLDIFRSTVGAAALGFARRALHETVEHAATRKLFGAPLGDLQLTQAAIADSATEVDAAALLVYRAAWTKDKGAARVTREAAMAKMFATEAAQHVIDRAVQLHGGRGVTKGEKVEELYREIRALRIYEGATEVQKVVIAREALEEPRGETGAGRGMMEHVMIRSGHVDTFARDNLPPRDAVAGVPVHAAGAAVSGAAQLRDRVVDKLGRGRRRRPHRDHLADRDADLRAACRAHQPHRQCADPRSRPGAGQSRAAARAEHSDDDRGLSGGDQGRRRVVATMPLLRAKELSYVGRPRRRSSSRCATRGSPTRWRRRGRSRASSSASSIGATASSKR